MEAKQETAANEGTAAEAAMELQKRALLSLMPSGIINYFTQFDAVKMFHIAALGRGACTVGKISDNYSKEVLVTRRKLIAEEVVEELFTALDKIIQNDGVGSLEQKRDVLDAICDSIYVLLGLAVVMGLPFDTAFGLVHAANMRKVMGEGLPKFREDGKILKPEGWESPDRALFELLMQTFYQATAATAKGQAHP